MTQADEPAFPHGRKVLERRGGGTVTTVPKYGGLTKREYFAALAMQGLVTMGWGVDSLLPERAEFAVANADALLAELAKERT